MILLKETELYRKTSKGRRNNRGKENPGEGQQKTKLRKLYNLGRQNASTH